MSSAVSARSLTSHQPLGRTRLSRPARRLGIAAAALIAWSGVGGVVSVLAGANTWSDAWGSTATLAAPWPMVLVQLIASAAAVYGTRRPAIVGSVVLLVGASLSGISGFFDGMLGREGLTPAYVFLQILLVATAWVVAVCAALRLRELVRAGR